MQVLVVIPDRVIVGNYILGLFVFGQLWVDFCDTV